LDAINLIHSKLENDTTLNDRTKLTPLDIKDLLNLCLETSGFIYDNSHYTAKESGPIGLSLMVVIAKMWMDHTVSSALELVKNKGLNIPREVNVFMDDSFGILKPATNTTHLDFNQCLNKIHPHLRFTFELEENGQLLFLDCLVTRLPNNSIATTISYYNLVVMNDISEQ
jgi:hypothetical protein